MTLEILAENKSFVAADAADSTDAGETARGAAGTGLDADIGCAEGKSSLTFAAFGHVERIADQASTRTGSAASRGEGIFLLAERTCDGSLAANLLGCTVFYCVRGGASQCARVAGGDEDVAQNARGTGCSQAIGAGSAGVCAFCAGTVGSVDEVPRPASHATGSIRWQTFKAVAGSIAGFAAG